MANFRMARNMPHVIHVGPCDSPGGIRTVMRTLAEHPPEGWTASLLASHSSTHIGMLRAARQAARALRRLPDDASTLVHLHAASDWSLRRKLRLAAACKAPVVLHLHSGDTARWFRASAKRADRVRSAIQRHVDAVVVLDTAWKDVLEPLIGPVEVVPNPVHPKHCFKPTASEEEYVLVMGRDVSAKRREFAIKLIEILRESRPEISLHLTGGAPAVGEGWTIHGWISEDERMTLLRGSAMLLLPSAFEGQPIAALEALACGIPVLASDGLPALPSTVVRAKFGNLASFASQAVELLEHPPNSTILAASVQSHSAEVVAQHWLAVYARVFR